jgi:hypothetical protein
MVGSVARSIVGRVTSAEWNEVEKAVDFILHFDSTGTSLRGRCPAGLDPRTGRMVTERELKSSLDRIRNMKVYYQPEEGKSKELDPQHIRSLMVQLDLKRMDMSVRDSENRHNANTFISKLFR